MENIQLKGTLIGRKLMKGKNKLPVSDIVHIQKEFRPKGPAENSIVEVIRFPQKSTASYIPWVGYFDLDRQIKIEPTLWEIVEPGQQYLLEKVVWKPFKF